MTSRGIAKKNDRILPIDLKYKREVQSAVNGVILNAVERAEARASIGPKSKKAMYRNLAISFNAFSQKNLE